MRTKLRMKRERRAKLRALRAQAKAITRATGVQHDIHHRVPVSRSGSDEETNISIVAVRSHESYHFLFSNLSPEGIAKMLTERWIDPNYEMIARKRYKVT